MKKTLVAIGTYCTLIFVAGCSWTHTSQRPELGPEAFNNSSAQAVAPTGDQNASTAANGSAEDENGTLPFKPPTAFEGEFVRNEPPNTAFDPPPPPEDITEAPPVETPADAIPDVIEGKPSTAF